VPCKRVAAAGLRAERQSRTAIRANAKHSEGECERRVEFHHAGLSRPSVGSRSKFHKSPSYRSWLLRARIFHSRAM